MTEPTRLRWLWWLLSAVGALAACDAPLKSCDGAMTCRGAFAADHIQVCGNVTGNLLAGPHLGGWLLSSPGEPQNHVTLPARVGVGIIRGYQRWVSARLGAHCRYTPSCSAYGVHALQTYGALTGSRLAVARIRLCTVEVPCGTPDPIGLLKPA